MSALPPDVNDLNALVPAKKKVALGSTTYVVPGDMPLEVYLRAQASFATDDEIESSNLLKQAFTDLLTFFVPLGAEGQAIRDALEVDLRPLGVRTILALLNAVYRDAEADDEVDDEDAAGKSLGAPTTEAATPTTTGTSSTESSPTPNSETETEPTPASAG